MVIFGSQSVDIEGVDNPADLTEPTSLAFDIPNVTTGTYPVRLRVNGVDSLPVKLTSNPVTLEFDTNQQVIVP